MSGETREAGASLGAAIRALAARCDGAIRDDGVGFAASDTIVGHRLAQLPEGEWDAGVRRLAWELARKYQGQLEHCGIDFHSMDEPEAVESNRQAVYAAHRRYREVHERYAEVEELSWRFFFPFQGQLVSMARALPGAKWSGREGCWRAARSREAAEFAMTQGFVPRPEADRAGLDEALVTDLALGVWDRPANVRMEEGEVVIAFDYDSALVSAVKKMGGGRFERRDKTWRFPATKAADAVVFGSVHELTVSAEMRGMVPDAEAVIASREAERVATLQASRALDAELELPEHLSGLRPFQRAGVAFALAKRRVLIGDVVGLGKTVQSLAAVDLAGAYPVIVVCPAGLKLNWRNEVRKWVPGRSTWVVAGKESQEIPPADVVIVNYDILHDREDDLKALPAQALVVDEIHAAKNGKRHRTQALKSIAEALPSGALRIGLSGTAILNRPAELIEPLRILGRFEDVGGSWKEYVRRYCDGYQRSVGRKVVWDVSGASNSEELNDRMRETCFVRRTKQDVMPELPPVQDSLVPIELSPEGQREYETAEADVVAYLTAKAMEIASGSGVSPESAGWHAAMKARQAEMLVRLTTLREICGRAKAPGIVDWAQGFLEGTEEKLIVFAWHKSVQERLVEGLDAVSIRGGEKPEQVESAKRAFMTDPSCRVLVASLAAASEGHTLTAASTVAFAELPWTPARVEQAIGRAYGRLSDAHGVLAVRLLGEGTIDDKMAALLGAKQAVVDAVLDGTASATKATSVAGDLMIDLAKRGIARRSADAVASSPKETEPRRRDDALHRVDLHHETPERGEQMRFGIGA